jgi:hypothetical protein
MIITYDWCAIVVEGNKCQLHRRIAAVAVGAAIEFIDADAHCDRTCENANKLAVLQIVEHGWVARCRVLLRVWTVGTFVWNKNRYSTKFYVIFYYNGIARDARGIKYYSVLVGIC